MNKKRNQKNKLNFEKFNNVTISTNNLILLDLRKTLLRNGLSVSFFLNHIIEKIAAKDEKYQFILEEAKEAFINKNKNLDLSNSINLNSTNQEEISKLTDLFSPKTNKKDTNKQQIAEVIYSLIEKELNSSINIDEQKD